MPTATLDPADLDGAAGIVIAGVGTGDATGHAVASAGDFNGDGFDDFIVAAIYADPDARADAGTSYLVFGTADGFPATLALASLLPGNGGDGSAGIVLQGGTPGESSGFALAPAGDINNDGLADLIVGSFGEAGAVGRSYLVFGSADAAPATLALDDLDGDTGVVLRGVDADDHAGAAVASAGDLNGDGFDDLVIGAYGSDRSYVVFGTDRGFAATFELNSLDGANGFVLDGIEPGDAAGRTVAPAGDVNGDGIGDLIVGADGAANDSGETYVVFGGVQGFPATLALAGLLPGNGGDGSAGFVLQGVSEDDLSGLSAASAGDLNGDGLDDLIVGAYRADPGGGAGTGEAYVVFGTDRGFPAALGLETLLPGDGGDGSAGFVLQGSAAGDYAGRAVASAGDIDGDGYDDLVVGAFGASGYRGETYVVFGGASRFPATFVLSDLLAANGGDGSAGFAIAGQDADDISGFSVAPAGDVNGDGFDDLLVGADGGDPDGTDGAGEAYLVFGTDFRGQVTHPGGAGDDVLTGTSRSDILIGGLGDDRLDGRGGRNADVMRGGAGDDTLVYDARDRLIDGGSGEDTLELARSTRALDLTSVRPGLLESIEVIDLSQRGNQTLTLDVHSLLGLSDASNTLRIEGASGDRVNAGDGWDLVRAVSVDGEAYIEYTQGAATLQVDSDINRAGIGANPINTVALASLDGATGFVLIGIDATDRSGFSVASAGDVNGDGFDDLIIGAPGADPGGKSYLVFGKAGGVAATLDLATLAAGDGSTGFALTGIDADDYSGFSVASAGDVNGDGFDDLIIGAYYASPNGVSYAGESYVVFGMADGFAATLDLATLAAGDGSGNAAGGFALTGIDANDYSGFSVASAGDVNGDGFDDLIIGAHQAAQGGDGFAGESYLVFGKAGGFAATLDLAMLAAGDGSGNAAGGVVLTGIDAFDRSGRSVASAGDVNGDGFDDLIIGAHQADPDGTDRAGESYLVFGRPGGFAATLDLATLDGSNGFVLAGIDAYDSSGYSVASASDVNGDGFDDLIIGAPGADPGGDGFAGESYVVFGKAGGFAATLDLATLAAGDGSTGFVLTGIDASDRSGRIVASAGDVNGDGFDDLIIGAPDAAPDSESGAGESYLVFGRANGFAATLDLATLAAGDGSTGFVLTGIDAFDVSGRSVASAGDVNGDGFDDLIIGADQANPGSESRAGESYVVYGTDFRGDVTHLGGDGDNTLIGTSRSDVLIGGLGDDRLDGRAGSRADVMRGGAGNDTLVYDARDRAIDGGSGEDTLELSSSTRRVDLTRSRPGLLEDIEVIDLSPRGGHTLTLDAATVLGLSQTSNTVRVEGAAGDRVLTTDQWDFKGYLTLDGAPFAEYTRGAATLRVDADVNRAGIATTPVATFALADLLAENGGNGSAGFVLRGVNIDDRAGASVASAGDVNGDGLDDLLIGAPSARRGYGDLDYGASYVVFGSAQDFPATLALAHLMPGNGGDGSAGFIVFGDDPGDFSAITVAAAGDVNGDGFGDILLGTPVDADNGANAGLTSLVLGSGSGFPATVDPDDRFQGISSNDRSASSLAPAGDFNGDGLDDFLIGAPSANPGFAGGGVPRVDAGETYVVFGSTGEFPDLARLLPGDGGDGSAGVVLEGIDGGDGSGGSVACAGDVNGDGFDDLIIGANSARPDGKDAAGESYLVFGRPGRFAATLELAALADGDGANGFVLTGIDAGDRSGTSVASAGDVNGDGFDDLVIGAYYVSPVGNPGVGESYVVFGRAGGFDATFALADLLPENGGNGRAGFVLAGTPGINNVSVASAGDVNGDGLDDLLIGAGANAYDDAGEAYVVFGGATPFAATFALADLRTGDGSRGFVIGGADSNTYIGNAIAPAGDINGDGFDDLMFGAPGAAPGGETFVVYGNDFRGDVTHIGGSGDDVLLGTTGSDVLVGGRGDDRLDGLGGRRADVLRGASGDDTLVYDPFDRLIDGGSGEDTLELPRNQRSVNLTTVRPGLLESIEAVDLSERGAHTLTVDAQTILGLSRDTNTLTVRGTAADRVVAGDGWVERGEVSIGDGTFAEYTMGNATLQVAVEVNRDGIGIRPAPFVTFALAHLLPENGGDGSAGFVLHGVDAGDRSGVSVASAGDVNGDGFDDLVIGAYRADPDGNNEAGESYVVFGGDGFAATLDLAAFAAGDGSTGFVLTGNGGGAYSGRSVAPAGDVNGDSFGDLIVAPPGANGYASESYLVFGSPDAFPATLSLASLDGSNGARLGGVFGGDRSGLSVASAGDINGDGLDDVLIGDPVAGQASEGKTYLVFGSATDLPGNLSELLPGNGGDGSAGFVLEGIDISDRSGASVASAGDVNGDGLDDLIIGAYFAGPDDADNAGETYVVFGRTTGFAATFALADLLPGNGGDGSNGFVLRGVDEDDRSGGSVASAGDVNGDGLADIIINAGNAAPGGLADASQSYVVFGRSAGLGATFALADLLPGNGGDGSAGFALDGRFGIRQVASAGDVNGDGFDDLFIGAGESSYARAGEAYVVFGGATPFAATFDLTELREGDGARGFVIGGADTIDAIGDAVASAGDVNGDGFDDLILGHRNGGDGYSGDTFVVYGADFGAVTHPGTDGDDVLLGTTASDVVIGGRGDDRLDGRGGRNADVLKGAAGDDTLVYAPNDRIIDGGSGEDTLELPRNLRNVDLTTAPHTQIRGIEVVDLSERGGHTLTVDVPTIVGLSDTGNTLRVEGAAGDRVLAGDGWNFVRIVSVDGEAFAEYTQGAATLQVDVDVNRAGIGTEAITRLSLDDLNATRGTVLTGIDTGDRAGVSVASAGDVDGDGFGDLIIGADGAYPDGQYDAGESYLVFGAAGGFAPTLDLASLAAGDGSGGFVLTGIDANDSSGRSVASAGDVNGDGFDDLIIGADYADPDGQDRAGESYLVFGAAGGFAPTLDLASLAAGDGSRGFVLTGIDANDRSGRSVASAGDLDGDGFDDLIIGADGTDQGGESYLVFGAAGGFAATFDVAALATGDGSAGFVLTGVSGDFSGVSVASAGDVNGDGFGDLIIGAYGAGPGGAGLAGESYLVYGSPGGFDAILDLATLASGDGSSGFVLTGIDAGDRSGRSVASAGDVNGDGFDDLIIGARYADPGGENDAGEAYLVFGRPGGSAATFDLAALAAGDGSAGFVLTGVDANDQAGVSVASAGDVNGDGFDDLVIGAFRADPDGGNDAGETYLVFGKAGGFAPTLDLASLATGDGSMGFVLTGIDAGDRSGVSVASAGDLDGDGFDDLIIGALYADPDGETSAGESYLIYGTDFRGEVTHQGGDGDDSLIGTSRSDILIGGLGDDRLDGLAGRNADVLRGAGGDDTLVYDPNDRVIDGGSGEDTLELGRGTPAVDLTTVRPGLLDSIEAIDLSARGRHTLTVDVPSLLRLSDSSNTVRIEGTSSDRVFAGDGWEFQRFLSIDGAAYSEYRQDAATLQVAFGIDQRGIGAASPSVIDLAALDGSRGFVLTGVAAGDRSGAAVASAGDLNGDGLDDVVVGAFGASGFSGESYVVYGTAAGFPGTVGLESLLPAHGGDGSAGFMLRSANGGLVGRSVASAGDVNGDGFGDLLIGAVGAGTGGETYVVFGDANGFPATLDLALLATGDGSTGFVLQGIDGGDNAARSVAAAGDVNGDGIDDLIIGADFADPGSDSSAGESYVVFGSDSGFAATFALSDLLTVNGGDGSAGFVLEGIGAYDYSGRSVASAGDINGDGFDDLIVGSYGANGFAGETYVVFGKAGGFAAQIDLATLAAGNGSAGFVLRGINGGDVSGHSVSSAGDINGDGLDDLLVGAYFAGNGEAYVVFGASEFGATLALSDLLPANGGDGSHGTVLRGVSGDDRAGQWVAAAGDVDGDGLDDFLVGAIFADAPSGDANVGATYLVFGSTEGFPATFDLADLLPASGGDGNLGLALVGIDTGDYSGSPVASAGDINGDGFDDLIIGSYRADPDGNADAGESYVVYGTDFRGKVTHLGGDADDSLRGSSSADIMIGGRGDDRLDGSNGDDIIKGGAGDDTLIGGRGADQLFGGNGDDIFIVDALDRIFEETASGIDTVITRASYTLGAHLENLTLEGGANARVLTGNALDNAITGNRRNDTLEGLGGDDTLDGGRGRDTLRGGEGDDILIFDRLDTLVDGGAGDDDTLRAGGAGATLDFTRLDVTRFTGIERIDLTGGGNDTLALSNLDLLSLSDTSNQLIVDGDAGDTVAAHIEGTGAWNSAGPVSLHGIDYDSFTFDDAALLVRNGMSLSGIDFAGT